MSDATEGMEPSRQSPRAPVWVAAVIAFGALAVGAGIGFVLIDSDDPPSAVPERIESVERQELVLEPAGVAGPQPFTTSVAVDEAPRAPAADLVATPEPTSDQPALYGGARNVTACDAPGLVTLLAQDPDKAAAWASALEITPAEIRDYVATLTPVVVRTDILVTNHGYAARSTEPRSSVLQAGTAVLVDPFGVPRVRCSSGNPLTEPAPSPAVIDPDVALIGEPWPGWDPAAVVVIGAASGPLSQFVLWDVLNGGRYIVLIGGAAPTTTTTAPPPPPPPPPPPSTAAPTPTDPLEDNDCRNDPPGDPTDGYGSGDVGCNPDTGEYVCYLGADIVPCGNG